MILQQCWLVQTKIKILNCTIFCLYYSCYLYLSCISCWIFSYTVFCRSGGYLVYALLCARNERGGGLKFRPLSYGTLLCNKFSAKNTSLRRFFQNIPHLKILPPLLKNPLNRSILIKHYCVLRIRCLFGVCAIMDKKSTGGVEVRHLIYGTLYINYQIVAGIID